ncbi:hypothetical protein SH668x_000020 [Planctomicrobium sp. SH668]|uniref:hypothetical protein n=1 Tax=Planctomicrobium sp. SH668 TaxID=3448126 RepID=UPI003F5B2734
MKNILAVALALTFFSTMAMADGLPVGSDVNAFFVKDVTGPSAGTKLCYRCRYGNKPVVSIFAREVNADVASLIHEVDGVVGKNQAQEMKGLVVLLSDEPEAKEEALKKVANEAKVENVPLTTFDGEAGPRDYKIAEDSEVTVMMWVGGKLKVNETFKKGELNKDSISGLVGKTSSILK